MYRVMHKNKDIAFADSEQITNILCPELCPGCFFVGMPLERWMESRMIDTHRSHSRQLFKALRLRDNASLEDILRTGHALTITDNWWIQEESENFDYRTLKQFNERLSDISLYGTSPSHSKDLHGYQQLGTSGSYEKTWRFENNRWTMYKQGNPAELISEYFAYQFLKNMGISVAQYRIYAYQTNLNLSDYMVLSEDFTENAKYDLDPFCNYFSDNEDIEFLATALLKKDPKLAKDYVEIVFYDALLFNVDRHNQNIGFLRDAESGEILRLAPAFDYNLCLASAAGITPLAFSQRNQGLVPYFLESKTACRLIRDIVPKRSVIVKALSEATAETKYQFSKITADFGVFQKYILNAYDSVTAQLTQEKALQTEEMKKR